MNANVEYDVDKRINRIKTNNIKGLVMTFFFFRRHSLPEDRICLVRSNGVRKREGIDGIIRVSKYPVATWCVQS